MQPSPPHENLPPGREVGPPPVIQSEVAEAPPAEPSVADDVVTLITVLLFVAVAIAIFGTLIYVVRRAGSRGPHV